MMRSSAARAVTCSRAARGRTRWASGGGGSNTFTWALNDRGTPGAPAADTITDFNALLGGDVLDLRELLVGENAIGSTGNLQNYLDFDTTSMPGSTVIRVSSTGGFTGGAYDAAVPGPEQSSSAGSTCAAHCPA